MTFLSPGLALLAAGIGVPALILLHVLRLRRLPQRVPTTLLWRRSVQDLEANVPFQRLRFSLLFVLQMLALLGAAIAAGQPVWRSDEIPASLVIVLDTRARMRALIEPPQAQSAPNASALPAATRFDAARARAREIIEARSGIGTEVHLVTARAVPGLVVSGAPRAVLDALDRVEQTDEPGDARDAMALAAQLAPDGEIVWVGDPAQATHANVGITVLSAQRSPTEPGVVDVLVSAMNSGDAPIEVPLVVTLDGASMAARTLRLPAAARERPGDAGRATLLVRVPARPGALLESRLATRDALPTDDAAALRFAPPAPIRVAFAAIDARAAEASPLRALLAVMDSVVVSTISCDAPASAYAGIDLIVADGCVPSVVRSRELATPWLIFAWPASQRLPAEPRWRAMLPGSVRSHPVAQGLAPFTVDVRPSGDAAPRAGENGSEPSHTSTGADAVPEGAIPLLTDDAEWLAFIDPRSPGVRFLFPLTATDWPADPSWVMTMQNAALWLVGDDGESAGTALRTGQAARVLVEKSDGSRAWIAVPPPARVGSVNLRTSDGAEVDHTISLLDESQSDLRLEPAPPDPRGFEDRAERLRAQERRNTEAGADGDDERAVPAEGPGAARPLWRWFAIAALLLIGVEWCVYLRTISSDRRARTQALPLDGSTR